MLITRFATLLLALTVASPANAQEPAAPADSVHAGCYLFNRPLDSSASGDLERADTTWYVIELSQGGALARPQLASAYSRREYAMASRWRAEGDSLVVLVSNRLVGWRLRLAPTTDGYHGVAEYLSDVIVHGQAPLRVPVSARRVACSPPPA